ncbi:non-ribosomal peptide synthetase/polyketide synthase [Streptomyces piniterrae]|uniref:Non-ribosomal peptide synthetase/polyketide synthase n=1 Tax=Streptomyces piniterrae TaxID=2571125 RepID=A0A4U0MT91_9ACTN|nr:condensation domain-containing protein [Streptomyces piniterrae]TJZ44123.1 non-ribosomal peptide synthetase/polyketide synthase [Streptomyces piniterrae]
MSSSSYVGALGAGQGHDFSGHYVFPAASAQQRLWFLCELEPAGNAAYNVVSAVRMTGELNRRWLQQAIDAVVERHESLRTGVALVDGAPQQVVLPTALVTAPLIDCRGLDATARQTRLTDTVREETARPFPLHQPPLMRMVLLRTADDEHVLVVTVHHIVCDGWSMEVFFRDLAADYAARAAGEPPRRTQPPIQYADYVAWQNEQLDGDRLAELLAHWREKLAGVQPLDLPADRPRPAVRTVRGAQLTTRIPADLVDRLGTLGTAHGATLFMVLLTAFKGLLAAYSGQRDIAVGTPVAGRGHPQAEELIGFFANTLVLRSELDTAAAFTEALETVRATCVDAFSHQDMPFDRLVEELRPPRDLSRTPLFQVMFALQNTPGVALELPGLSLAQVDTESASAKFDLWLSGVPDNGEVRLRLEYNRDLFDPATAERLLGHYLTLLDGIAADPRRAFARLLDTDDPRERARVRGWARAAAPTPAAPDAPAEAVAEAAAPLVTESLAHRLERTPHESSAVAISAPDGTLTHRELHQRADLLAHRLREAGAGPGTLVGIHLPPSRELAIAVLAALKTGAAQVHLAPGAGPRTAWVLADAAPDLLIGGDAAAESPAGWTGPTVPVTPGDRTDRRRRPARPAATGGPAPDDPACVVYPFGSAVRPPGVTVSHRVLADAVDALGRAAGITAEDAVAVLGDAAGELTAPGLLLPLVLGGRAVILPAPDAEEADGGPDAAGPSAAAGLAGSGVTTGLATPDTWRRLLDQDWTPPTGLRVVSVGEAPTGGLTRRLAAAGAWVCAVHSPAGAPVSGIAEAAAPEAGAAADRARPWLGRPGPGRVRQLLDAQLLPVPLGTVGELYVGGGLAYGYRNRPALTAERFVPDPFSDDPGARLYRTGDLCRYTPDGELEFVGRAGGSVRLRDRWVDPAEAESVLADHPLIDRAAVVTSEFGDDVRLVGWLVPDRSGTGDDRPATDGELVRLLRRDIAATLPDDLLPQVFGVLPELPLRPDGRVDRRKLQAKKAEAVFGSTDATPPRDSTERRLVLVFQDMLGIQAPGVHANFFALGGHSLLAAKLIDRVRKDFGVLVPVRDFFKRPTAAGLADALRAAKDGRPQRPGRGTRPQAPDPGATPTAASDNPSDEESDSRSARRSGTPSPDALAGISDDEVTRLLNQHLK